MKNWDRRHLPSLTSLATFEVAAKHLSFTTASHELNVSQAAVSQQVKYLERAVERKLFLRKHNALELTFEGRSLLSAIGKGLDSISQAVAELQGVLEVDTIACSATVAVASHWLKPLTDEFSLLNPKARFVILASDEDDTLRNFEEIDVAVICGNERCEPGEEIHFLFPEVVKPVCSPAFFERYGPFDSLEALARANLMHLHQKHWNSAAIGWQPITWKHWFTSEGFIDFSMPSGLVSNNYPLLLDAATDGRGIVLGWQHIVERSIAAHKLQIAYDASLRLERGNYLKLNPHARETRIVKDFVEFILDGLRGRVLW